MTPDNAIDKLEQAVRAINAAIQGLKDGTYEAEDLCLASWAVEHVYTSEITKETT